MQVTQEQIIGKIFEIPDIQSAYGTQTSERLKTAPVRHVEFSETVEVMEFLPPLPVLSAPPVCATTPVVDEPPMLVECVQPAAPVVENVAPAPAATYAAPAPLVDCIAAPVDEFSAPAPVEILGTPSSMTQYVAPAPAVINVVAAPRSCSKLTRYSCASFGVQSWRLGLRRLSSSPL